MTADFSKYKAKIPEFADWQRAKLLSCESVSEQERDTLRGAVAALYARSGAQAPTNVVVARGAASAAIAAALAKVVWWLRENSAAHVSLFEKQLDEADFEPAIREAARAIAEDLAKTCKVDVDTLTASIVETTLAAIELPSRQTRFRAVFASTLAEISRRTIVEAVNTIAMRITNSISKTLPATNEAIDKIGEGFADGDGELGAQIAAIMHRAQEAVFAVKLPEPVMNGLFHNRAVQLADKVREAMAGRAYATLPELKQRTWQQMRESVQDTPRISIYPDSAYDRIALAQKSAESGYTITNLAEDLIAGVGATYYHDEPWTCGPLRYGLDDGAVDRVEMTTATIDHGASLHTTSGGDVHTDVTGQKVSFVEVKTDLTLAKFLAVCSKAPRHDRVPHEWLGSLDRFHLANFLRDEIKVVAAVTGNTLADLAAHESFGTVVDISTHWCTHEHFFIIADRPEQRVIEEDVYHCATGPAIKWRDGFSSFAWKGMAVPSQWIEDPKSIPSAGKQSVGPDKPFYVPMILQQVGDEIRMAHEAKA